MAKCLIVLLGPTGVGKTDLSLSLSKRFGAPIISADSRQFFREMQIGTAAPTPAQLAQAKHYFVGHKSATEEYSCGSYETDALTLLESEVFPKTDFAILTGGSMLYIDAVCNGIDDFPAPDLALREELTQRLEREGLDSIRMQLKMLDPVYYNQVDLKNPQRILKGLEVTLQTGKPYSSFLTRQQKARPFTIIKIGLTRPREELYQRINMRVDMMVAEGLVEEARSLLHLRNLNSLNTVGYRELFDYFDGTISLQAAIELIKRNSRRYAKRQLTWWARDMQIAWFHPDNIQGISEQIEALASKNDE